LLNFRLHGKLGKGQKNKSGFEDTDLRNESYNFLTKTNLNVSRSMPVWVKNEKELPDYPTTP
jgi:hypothetical protein